MVEGGWFFFVEQVEYQIGQWQVGIDQFDCFDCGYQYGCVVLVFGFGVLQDVGGFDLVVFGDDLWLGWQGLQYYVVCVLMFGGIVCQL